MCSNSFVACFGCMEEDINALGSSAQDVVLFTARKAANMLRSKLKANCAFNFEQAQRIEVHSRIMF